MGFRYARHNCTMSALIYLFSHNWLGYVRNDYSRVPLYENAVIALLNSIRVTCRALWKTLLGFGTTFLSVKVTELLLLPVCGRILTLRYKRHLPRSC
jgi:hypothetical protein